MDPTLFFCPIKKYVYKISTYREFRLQIVI